METIAKTVSESQFRRECVEAGKPGVLVGGAAHWLAVARWTPGYLAEKLSEKSIDVFTSASGVFDFGDTDAGPRKDRMAFGEVASAIANGSMQSHALYVMQLSIDAKAPVLAADLGVPAGLGEARAFPFLWFGSAGNVTPIHFDGVNNLVAQIRGRKRFTIYEPGQTEALYPVPISARFPHLGQIDVEAPDFDRFPKFRDAEAMQYELGPGDLLFLPPFYWHHVRSLDVAASVTFYWPPRFEQCLVAPCLRDLRAAYLQDRMATVGSPFADNPGGLIGAARRALDLGQIEFAVLLAGGALTQSSKPPSASEAVQGRISKLLATAQSVAEGGDAAPYARFMVEEANALLSATRAVSGPGSGDASRARQRGCATNR